MEQEPFGRRAVRIDVIVALIELLLGYAQELDADADSHLFSLVSGWGADYTPANPGQESKKGGLRSAVLMPPS
jgi:hypothetical protein